MMLTSMSNRFYYVCKISSLYNTILCVNPFRVHKLAYCPCNVPFNVYTEKGLSLLFDLVTCLPGVCRLFRLINSFYLHYTGHFKSSLYVK